MEIEIILNEDIKQHALLIGELNIPTYKGIWVTDVDLNMRLTLIDDRPRYA